MAYSGLSIRTLTLRHQLETLLQSSINSITSDANRRFLADTIREVGLTESIRKRFNANGALDRAFQLAGIESFNQFSFTNDQLADAIIGTEDGHSFTDIIRGWWADCTKQFTAGYRWLQSLTDNSSSSLSEIVDLTNTIKRNSSKLSSTDVNVVNLQAIMKIYSTVDTIKARETACRYLEELKDLDVEKDAAKLSSKANEIRKIAEDLLYVEKKINAADGKTDIKAAAAFNQAKSVAQTVTRALADIAKTNKSYAGWWKTGFRAGKLDTATKVASDAGGALVAYGLGSPIVGAVYSGIGYAAAADVYGDVRIIASYSWSAISRACDVDYALCKMLIDNLDEISDKIS